MSTFLNNTEDGNSSGRDSSTNNTPSISATKNTFAATTSSASFNSKLSLLGLLLPSNYGNNNVGNILGASIRQRQTLSPLHKGKSFVNLPPPSRIEQNAHSTLGHHVSSEKFVNHMRSSPPTMFKFNNNNDTAMEDEQQRIRPVCRQRAATTNTALIHNSNGGSMQQHHYPNPAAASSSSSSLPSPRSASHSSTTQFHHQPTMSSSEQQSGSQRQQQISQRISSQPAGRAQPPTMGIAGTTGGAGGARAIAEIMPPEASLSPIAIEPPASSSLLGRPTAANTEERHGVAAAAVEKKAGKHEGADDDDGDDGSEHVLFSNVMNMDDDGTMGVDDGRLLPPPTTTTVCSDFNADDVVDVLESGGRSGAAATGTTTTTRGMMFDRGHAINASIRTTASASGVSTGTGMMPPPPHQQQQLQEKASLKSSLKVEDTILRLNIGGSSYRIRTRSILKHGADTLLGRFVRMNEQHRRAWADAFFEEEGEYFFERVPRYFDPVYDFYASGKLHVPKDLCFEKFMAELRFWAVSKAKMDDCCSPVLRQLFFRKPHHSDTPEKDHFIGLRCAKVRRRLWLILEGHSNSRWWKAFEITSTSFVVLSITALILASMPEFQVPDTSNQYAGSIASATIYPTYPKVSGAKVSTTTVIKDGEDRRVEMVEHPVFNQVENLCVIYFAMEYGLRLWVAPQKVQFIKEFLNVIDLLAIAPFVFELILVFIGIRGDNIRKVRWAFLTVRLLRVLRVVRIAKLGRFSPGLANFALTLRKSKKQMQMVAIVLLTVIIFFSTLMYFMEKDEPNTMFTSIPAAFWWCLFSQTKWVPQTAAGKIVGGGAITCGVLVLALPIAILVNNFMQIVRLREEKLLRQYASINALALHQHQQQQSQQGCGTGSGGERV